MPVVQLLAKLAPRAVRMAFRMILASRTMARPMKPLVRVFLPEATLPGSPLERV